MAGQSKWANIRRRAEALAWRQSRGDAAGAPGPLVRYEGYGPGGAAVLVECRSGDLPRTSTEVRGAFLAHGGRLGAHGSVSYLFNSVGLLTYPPGTDPQRLMRAALAAGAEDVVRNADTCVEVLADPLEFVAVRAALTRAGFVPATAEVTWRAASSLELSGESAQAMVQLLEALERLEQVHDVHSNVEISAEVLGLPRAAL
jgi:transcriptional/translational regulatory protein YebC/TACO1